MDGCIHRQFLAVFLFFALIAATQAVPCNSTESFADVSCSTTQTNGLEYVVCECLPGYELQGPASVAVCVETGQGWGETTPNCTAIQCSSPEAPSGGFISPVQNSYVMGETVTYSCREGFEEKGDYSRECQAGGTWSGTGFSCLPCPSGGHRYNTDSCFIPVNNGIKWSQAKLGCEANGWSLAKVDNIEEQTFLVDTVKERREHWIGGKEDRNWVWQESQTPIEYLPWAEGEPNDLDSEDCIHLSALPGHKDYRWNDNGCDNQEDGDIPFYAICQYELHCPNNTLPDDYKIYKGQCLQFNQTQQNWNTAKDTCAYTGGWLVEILDQEMQEFLNETITTEFSTTLAHWWIGGKANGSRVWRWTDGELVTDTFWATDQSNNWDPDKEKCIQINLNNPRELSSWQRVPCDEQRHYICRTDALNITTCGDPGVPLHGVRSGIDVGGSFNTSDVVQFTCDEGYELLGSVSRECLSNGSWSGQETTCNIISCGEPTALANGNVTVLSHEYRGVAVLSCAEGYQMEGEPVIVCSSNGTWTSLNFTCIEMVEITSEYLTTPSDVTTDIASTSTQPVTTQTTTSAGFTTPQLTTKVDDSDTATTPESAGATTLGASTLSTTKLSQNPTTQNIATTILTTFTNPVSTQSTTIPQARSTSAESTTMSPPQATSLPSSTDLAGFTTLSGSSTPELLQTTPPVKSTFSTTLQQATSLPSSTERIADSTTRRGSTAREQETAAPVESTTPLSTTLPQATSLPSSTEQIADPTTPSGSVATGKISTTSVPTSRTTNGISSTSVDATTVVSTDAGEGNSGSVMGSSELLIIIIVSCVLGLILLIVLLISICWCYSCRKDQRSSSGRRAHAQRGPRGVLPGLPWLVLDLRRQLGH
ncbi:sushi, von Willebrand factor type A, EGF and pentraxin domain-containing protein 1-like isoform X2 [Patiria miniata]|uniref:Uncharacterized protein n=1 Tax=Patiria miniata TaxID=46514 RepID=A0A914A1X2_PATMI|nr:sushi, von Willebrand factor type A, EGF and pentraxin domain-containing protein 1-like isoform X2 [Patiria miniata]